MRRADALVAVASGLVMAATITGTVGAGASPYPFPFHDCIGPSGTPTSFTAEKMEVPFIFGAAFSQATAYRLVDGSAIFIALIRGDIHNPPGLAETNVATTTCLVDTPLKGTVSFSGFLTPNH